jgi:hypothetical protein
MWVPSQRTSGGCRQSTSSGKRVSECQSDTRDETQFVCPFSACVHADRTTVCVQSRAFGSTSADWSTWIDSCRGNSNDTTTLLPSIIEVTMHLACAAFLSS